ncbi:MAG: UDP-N-acetylmuramoyl-L-alanine--D-glutamate ligase, partial [Elusimicrobia bacterium]|nr:UDP-N-acetylmuramoyl-L-alanine--D-glutamate ligase [Elusimicrobiota bacterium]
GTNGKTTTALLTAAIFRAAGRRSRPCGNLGLPFCERAAAAGARDVLIAEVSSYQLEDSTSFRPQAAALLNVTADHLEHHGSMERYLKAKARCFAEMGPQESAVFNADDPLCLRVARQTAARKYFFASAAGTRVQAWIEGPRIAIRLDGKPALRLVPPPLPGRHNLANAMAAALLALSRGVKPAAIQRAFKSFKGVEHRLEDCGVFRGLRCVNDSKATNVDSTLAALEALRPPRQTPNILLILGGLHKGSPYTPLRQELERSVKGVLTIGSAARKIEEDLAGAVPVFACGELSVAVETAFKIGAAGDLLLLSPACASFDQFKNFEERGRLFKKLVRQGR